MAEREPATVFSSSQGSPLSPRLNPTHKKGNGGHAAHPLAPEVHVAGHLIALNFHATGFTQLQEGRRPRIR